MLFSHSSGMLPFQGVTHEFEALEERGRRPGRTCRGGASSFTRAARDKVVEVLHVLLREVGLQRFHQRQVLLQRDGNLRGFELMEERDETSGRSHGWVRGASATHSIIQMTWHKTRVKSGGISLVSGRSWGAGVLGVARLQYPQVGEPTGIESECRADFRCSRCHSSYRFRFGWRGNTRMTSLAQELEEMRVRMMNELAKNEQGLIAALGDAQSRADAISCWTTFATFRPNMKRAAALSFASCSASRHASGALPKAV